MLEMCLWQSFAFVTALVVAVLCGLSDVRTPVCFLISALLDVVPVWSGLSCLDFLLVLCTTHLLDGRFALR